MHPLSLAEADLTLCRMHIHVDLHGVNVKEEAEGRLRAVIKHVAVTLLHRVQQRLILHAAAVHEEELRVTLLTRRGRRPDPAGHGETRGRRVDFTRRIREFLRENHVRTFPRRLGGERVNHAAVRHEAHINIGMRQRRVLKLPETVRGFRRFGLQEFPSCRGLEEEIHHFDLCALAAGRGHHAILADRPGVILVRRTADQGEARDRGDGSECLTPEPEASDTLKLNQIPDLARRVALQRERQLFLRNAAAVIRHGYASETAALDPDLNPGRAGVKRVFDKLLHDRCGALNHLACRNLADQLVRELGDRTPRCRLLFLLDFFHSHSADHVFSRFPYTRSNDGTRLSCYDREFPVLLSASG